jgi:hypothetical protein
MIFRKPSEESFTGKALNCDYRFISTLNSNVNSSALLVGKAKMSARWLITYCEKTSSFLKI